MPGGWNSPVLVSFKISEDWKILPYSQPKLAQVVVSVASWHVGSFLTMKEHKKSLEVAISLWTARSRGWDQWSPPTHTHLFTLLWYRNPQCVRKIVVSVAGSLLGVWQRVHVNIANLNLWFWKSVDWKVWFTSPFRISSTYLGLQPKCA